MKIIDTSELIGTDREVKCPNGGFTSFRAILARDGMGFSLHRTFIPKGSPQHWHYAHHLEACYCIEGRGVITDLATGNRHLITPGVIYSLDRHDDHTFEALEDVTLISVFNPPVTGKEVHDENGSYHIPKPANGNDYWE